MIGFPGLTFEPEGHVYRFNGEVVPSVTQLLEPLHSFAGVPDDVLQAAQQRGTDAHLLCQYHDEGDLNPSSVAECYAGYLDAWTSFCREYGARWELIEQRLYSRRFRYAGTVDRVGTLERFPRTRWVLDIKTSAQKHRVWGLQTAAYRNQLIEHDAQHALDRRATVQINANGTYAFHTWDDPADWHAFQALTTLYHWGNQ